MASSPPEPGIQALLYILSGPDDFSRSQSLYEIKRSVGDEETLAANFAFLEGQHLTVDQLRSVCETAPFLTEKRLVVVHGLLQRPVWRAFFTLISPGRSNRAGFLSFLISMRECVSERGAAPLKSLSPSPNKLSTVFLNIPFGEGVRG